MRTTVFQQQNCPLDRDAFGLGKSVPGLEFIRDLDIPRDNKCITHT